MTRAYFHDLSTWLKEATVSGETYLASYGGERSTFSRFNHGKIRQLGDVAQTWIDLRLIKDNRQLSSEISLTGEMTTDQLRISHQIASMREHLAVLPEDPHILINQEVCSTDLVHPNNLPETGLIIEDIVDLAAGLDLVGILASGPIYRGFSNSFGQFNWFETSSFNFDWSLYLHSDKAVKSSVAGPVWRRQDFEEAVADAQATAKILEKEPKTIDPGKYRSYLAPAAVGEITELLAWGAFGAKSVKTKQSPLNRLYAGEVKLDQRVTITENTGGGASPNFDASGFVKPDSVPLIAGGAAEGTLSSARSAQEFNMASNGANESEAPESLEIGTGQLDRDHILAEIGTGLFVQNLWYLNYSDRNQCRMTGMTRFATLWVENGKIDRPVNVMRFDESFFDMFGDKLMGLTKDQDVLFNASTYDYRATGGQKLPGLLVDDFNFTL